MFKFSECRGLCISDIGRNITDLYRPITSKEYRWRIDGGGKFRKRETVVIRSDEELTLETSALKLLTVANSRYQLSWKLPNYVIRYRLYSDPNPISLVAYLPLPCSKFYNWNPIPILINSTPPGTWLERLNAGELKGRASKPNLNLRGIVMRAFEGSSLKGENSGNKFEVNSLQYAYFANILGLSKLETFYYIFV